MVGGLGFTLVLKDDPKATHPPKLWKIPAIVVSGDYWNTEPSFLPPGPRRPMDLGFISCGEPPAPKALERDWMHLRLALSPSLAVYVTRLSPALVFDCAAPRLTLFGGGKTTPIGYATPRGVFKADPPSAPMRGNAGPQWLLVWFGRDAALRSTRFPWPGNPVQFQYSYPNKMMISAVDCPMLLVFERTPASIKAQDGLALEAAGQAKLGKVVLVPICGDLYPLASETEAWAKNGKLPENVAASCQWWADHLAEVPMSARQRYAYDDKTDTVTVSSETTYLKVREGGKRLAPLPPILTIAREQGFPLRLSGKPVRTTVITALGPYAAIDGTDKYEYSVTGLGKYVRESSAVAEIAKEPQELRDRLKEEIAKIIKAGHLAAVFPPLDVNVGHWNQAYGKMADFSAPGQTLSVLGQALPLLDKDQREALRAYLKKERTDYPPESVAVTPLNVGARREGWRMDATPPRVQNGQTLFDWQDSVARGNNGYVKNHLLRPEGLYALAAYTRSVEPMGQAKAREAIQKVLGPYFKHQDWATLGCLAWPGTLQWLGQIYCAGRRDGRQFRLHGPGGRIAVGLPDGRRREPALALGPVRRCGHPPLRPGPLSGFPLSGQGHPAADGPVGDQAAVGGLLLLPGKDQAYHKLLAALYRQPDWMVQHFRNEGSYSGHLYSFKWTKPEDDVRGVARMTEYGAYFDDTVQPYDALTLAPYAGLESPELGRFLEEIEQPRARILADRVAENLPGWYLTYATATLGGEANYHHPLIAYHQFLLRAWVLHEPPEKLARYVDIPWMERGDLYYIHKLVETIKAYRGVKWEKD